MGTLTYFRNQLTSTGAQFERNLDRSLGRGFCQLFWRAAQAPCFDTNNFHAAVVELCDLGRTPTI